MDERISDCWMVRLIKAARERHDYSPVFPLKRHYIDGYSSAEDNDGWHVLHYHVRPDKEGTAYCIAIHEHTGEIIY